MKQSGIPSAFLVGGRDLAGDIGALSAIDSGQASQDASGLDTEGTERIGLRLDGSMAYSGFWNPATARSVETLSPLGGIQQVSYVNRLVLGAYAATLRANVVKFTSVNGQDGSLVVSGEAQAAAGVPLEWGRLLTVGKQTFATTQAIASWVADTVYALNALVVPTTANGHYYKATVGGTSDDPTEPTWPTNGTSVVDNTVTWTDQGLLPNGIDDIQPYNAATSTAFGFAAYLHALSIGSGSATVTLQDSANRIAWANLTGGAFTAVSAAGAQRITATGTVRRYVRAYVTGSFTNLSAVVSFVRYLQS